MKILLYTPIYHIKGRENLFHDTSAIHYLVKPWAKEHEVQVIFLYMQSITKITRYLNQKERGYYMNGYHYEVDCVKVSMCEIQNLLKREIILSKFQVKRLMNFTYKILANSNFHPDIVVSHIPVATIGVVSRLFPGVTKMAVLHATDAVYTTKYPQLIDLINSTYQQIFARSKALYLHFKSKNIVCLSSEIISSGIPSTLKSNRLFTKPQCFTILYAGKLIKRKHIDSVIIALSMLHNKYSFILKIYGEGREKKYLLRLAKKKLPHQCFKFNDFISREEIFKQMRLADIFVMPSTNETLGLVYLEAMRQGCITIGTEGEGADDIIQHCINGFLVRANDLLHLVDTIQTIFNTSEMDLQSISTLAQDITHNYNDYDIGQKYIKAIITVYEENKK
jgi:glycosyltransferase involved in cell wall biosynthesis